MKLATVKTARETGIPGIEFVYTDKHVTEIILGKVRIRMGESYNNSLKVLIETPFDTTERHRVTAKLEGFPDAVSFHDSEYEANRASSDFPSQAVVTVERVTVNIDEAGNVTVADKAAPEAPADVTDPPF